MVFGSLLGCVSTQWRVRSMPIRTIVSATQNITRPLGPTAASLAIGDEILTGKTLGTFDRAVLELIHASGKKSLNFSHLWPEDTNTSNLAKLLFERGTIPYLR